MFCLAHQQQTTAALGLLLLLSTWSTTPFVTTTVTAAAAAASVDHGKALTEWLRSTPGGFFHPNLEIRQYKDTPYYGMYTTAPITENDMMLRIPRELLIEPLDVVQVGDVVRRVIDRRAYRARVYAQHDNNHTYVLEYDDGDADEYVPADEFDMHNPECKTVQRLVQELRLGEQSPVAPYMNYLKSQPTGQLPSAWSQAGQDVLCEIIGFLVGAEEPILPPYNTFYHIRDYHEDCERKDALEEQLWMLLHQRGWDELMIPVFDMMSHGNGHWLNTKVVNSVHEDPKPVIVQARRDIGTGEEIYTTYNFCEDCGARKLWYGTPELLRDYGFVEQYPQRWVFENQDVIFDLDYDYDNQLQLRWVKDKKLTQQHVPFFQEHLQRLQDLGETVFAQKQPDVPDSEWEMLVRFRNDYIAALDMALKAVSPSDKMCREGSCAIAASLRYDMSLDEEILEDWPDTRPVTCHDYRDFGVAFWEDTEVIQTPYQRITYLSNPTLDPGPDTCFMLDTVWQICTSYRPHYHEMAVHYTARFLNEVKRVLFVGGGDSMLLHEILKYPSLEKVIGLELDQFVTRSAFKHFGVQPHFDNEKVEWWFGDAAKSMLMLPRDMYGTFDMVLVDLSETVVALSVTKELNVMEALSLLIKPDGILLKNEYNYFPTQKEIFRDALHIHFYNTTIVCSQSLILGSNGVDFLRGEFKDHNVNTIYHWMENPNVRFEISRDYQKNNTNPQAYCIESDKYVAEPTVQETSPGITMIVEAEEATAKLESSEDIKKMVEETLKKQGFSVESTVLSEPSQPPVTVTILKEGYVVARVFPEQKYCGYDIHLWSDFEKHNGAKKALVEAVGGVLDSPSTSSFRIVSGGMFGVTTWKEDEKKQGPKLEECKASIDTGKKSKQGKLVEKEFFTVLQESMGIVRDESKFAVGVICGKEGTPCKAVDALKKAGQVKDVVALHSCANLVPGVEFMEDGVARVYACEKATWNYLQKNVVNKKKKIRALVVDSSAESAFVSVIHTICTSPVNKRLFFGANMTVVAPILDEGKTWRRNFVDSFRTQIFPMEPSFKSDVYFNTTDGATVFELDVFSSGEIMFIEHMVEFVEKVEKKTKLLAEISNVRGGDFLMQEPFIADKIYLDSDFDQATQLKQWESQKPLALQVMIQLGPSDKRKKPLSTGEIQSALMAVLIKMVKDDGRVDVKKFTPVGDGCVLVALWNEGHVIVLWDGRDHIDISLFLYKEDMEYTRSFEGHFIQEVSGYKLNLRDVFPRGTGRVVNFAKDLAENPKPRWI